MLLLWNGGGQPHLRVQPHASVANMCCVALVLSQRSKFLRNLPDDEREAIVACFNSIDEDCSGSLTTAELGELLRHTYGMEPNREQLMKLKAEVDEDGNGFITIDEFIGAMAVVPELQDAGDVFTWKCMFAKCADPRGHSPRRAADARLELPADASADALAAFCSCLTPTC